ncbi:MAG TPA: Tim44-like domain-containing protein, partial [Caldimonas sp.]
ATFAARRHAPGAIVPRRAGFAIPAGLDGEQVLDAARGRFLRLQAAWDAADVSALRSLTTPEMLEELLHVLTARESRTSRTDVISLHAELLGLEELGAAYLASIEFSGLIRESAEQGEVPFRELWMLAGSKDDGTPSWRLARQQALL